LATGLYDSSFTVFSQTAVSNYSDYFITFNSLNLFGFISLNDFAFGILTLFLKEIKLLIYFFILFLFFSFLSLDFSKGIWEIVPFTNFLQFPFRLLSIVGFAAAYLVSFK